MSNVLTCPKLETVYLYPAQLCISDQPGRAVTVLGSCVSVTMFSPRLRIGGICHGMLPRCRARHDCTAPCVEAFKYMDCALRYMLRRFQNKGITNEEIEVKIFGGADTLASKSSNSIGRNNVKIALDFLRREKLHVSAADVGDAFGRKVIFGFHTGEVFVKRLKNSNNGKS